MPLVEIKKNLGLKKMRHSIQDMLQARNLEEIMHLFSDVTKTFLEGGLLIIMVVSFIQNVSIG